jgi:hypothetical protein
MVDNKRFNSPKMQTADGQDAIPRYKHSPITIDHFGTKIAIHENGTVTLTKLADEKDDEGNPQFDELTVPASLIFKAAQFLKATRSVEYVAVKNVNEKDLVSKEE